jgi:hypothetical protein
MRVSHGNDTHRTREFDEEDDVGEASEQFPANTELSGYAERRTAFRSRDGERMNRSANLVQELTAETGAARFVPRDASRNFLFCLGIDPDRLGHQSAQGARE